MTEFKCNGPGFKAHLDKTRPSISVCSIVELAFGALDFVARSTRPYRIPGRRQLYQDPLCASRSGCDASDVCCDLKERSTCVFLARESIFPGGLSVYRESSSSANLIHLS